MRKKSHYQTVVVRHKNVSHTSRYCTGLQACTSQLNEFTIYVPCFGCSLNLVGLNAVEYLFLSLSHFFIIFFLCFNIMLVESTDKSIGLISLAVYIIIPFSQWVSVHCFVFNAVKTIGNECKERKDFL